ncbi:MAG: hypothetical protein OXC19_23225 [Bryobacterales bacterium]|nr:hypothetical protein [Bryobacterales bacterium]
MADTTTEIARSIVSGDSSSSESAVWAANRHLDMLKASSVEGSQVTWHPDEAERLFDFCEEVVLTKAGPHSEPVKLVLEPWQKFLFGQLIGWKQFDAEMDREVRRYKDLYYCKQYGGDQLQALIGVALYCFLSDPWDGKQFHLILDRPDDKEYAREEILWPTWLHNRERFQDLRLTGGKARPTLRRKQDDSLELTTVPGPLTSHPRMIIGYDLKRRGPITRCQQFHSDLGKSWGRQPIYILTNNQPDCRAYSCRPKLEWILSIDFDR